MLLWKASAAEAAAALSSQHTNGDQILKGSIADDQRTTFQDTSHRESTLWESAAGSNMDRYSSRFSISSNDPLSPRSVDPTSPDPLSPRGDHSYNHTVMSEFTLLSPRKPMTEKHDS